MEAGEGLSPWLASALEALRYNWGEAYEIDVSVDGQWTAIRKDGLGGVLREPGPEELRAQILKDYELKPVKRR